MLHQNKMHEVSSRIELAALNEMVMGHCVSLNIWLAAVFQLMLVIFLTIIIKLEAATFSSCPLVLGLGMIMKSDVTHKKSSSIRILASFSVGASPSPSLENTWCNSRMELKLLSSHDTYFCKFSVKSPFLPAQRSSFASDVCVCGYRLPKFKRFTAPLGSKK